MDRPHSNNSNNIHVTGTHLYNHSPQMLEKSSCNGDTGSGCLSLDIGYSSFNPEDSQPYHSTCNLKSERHMGHFQTPGSVPNGPFTREPCHKAGPLQSPLQNGHLDQQPSQSYSGHSGSRHFSYPGEAVDRYQRSGPIPSGPPLTPYPQNGYQSQVLDGPTSPRPQPPVVRKHSSFMRQNAIEEEIDDIDELNDSGFGSMRRTTGKEGVRRSRSKDVSDAPTDDVNNNLAPRKLERAHSSQDRTDNDLAQYQGEKRRCSSEQLQRSNGSSGYHSAGNLQGELPAGDGTKLCDIGTTTTAKSAASAEASAAASTALSVEDEEYMNDIKLTLDGLTGGLNACKQEVWKVEDLHEEFFSIPNPAVQQILGSDEVHSQLMRALSVERFSRSVLLIPTNRGHVDKHVDEDDHLPNTSGDLLISPNESAQDDQQDNDVRGNGTATRKVSGEEVSKAQLHEDTLDQATKDDLQTLLEKRAYCEAMEHNACLECHYTELFQKKFKQCYLHGKLDQCSDSRDMVKAYWNHSKSCRSVRCVLPYCGYFKDLCSEKGLLHDPEMHFFEEALGCLIKVKEIDVLERLHELQQLQQPAVDGEKAWSADANAESYLKKGQHYTDLRTEARLCKLGHFSPIRCKARQHKVAPISVIIKKVRCYPSLTATLQMLHSKSQPVLEGIISSCLWYRQIKGEKLLVCSTYLSEKSLSSYLDGYGEETLEKYWIEACEAAVMLHESGILYLNWKVDHLVVTDEDHVKLCNFDYAVDIRSSRRGLRGSCSEEWRGMEVPEHVKTGLDPRIAPPEVLNGEGLSPESDTWGLGCLLYQLYNEGCLPYLDLRHLSDDAIREKLTNGHSAYVPVTPKTQMLSKMCWQEKKEERKLPVELVNIFNNQGHKVFMGVCEETRYRKPETAQQER